MNTENFSTEFWAAVATIVFVHLVIGSIWLYNRSKKKRK